MIYLLHLLFIIFLFYLIFFIYLLHLYASAILYNTVRADMRYSNLINCS